MLQPLAPAASSPPLIGNSSFFFVAVSDTFYEKERRNWDMFVYLWIENNSAIDVLL
jgi:hypothetical protein